LHEADASKQGQVSLLVYLVPNKLHISETLVSNAGREEFVEIEAVFH
jgi:hypothetical protein